MTEAVLYYGAGGAPQRVAPYAVPGAPVFTFGDSLPTTPAPKEGDTHFFEEGGCINPVRYDGTQWVWGVEPLRILVVDSGSTDRVYFYNMSGVEQSRGFNLHSTNSAPTGIAATATRIYVANFNTPRKVFVYNHSGVRQNGEEFNLYGDNDMPQGIAATATRIYVVDSGDSNLFIYNLSGTRQTSEETFNLPLGSRGIAITATRVYVTPNSPKKIFVYDSMGARQTSEDFNLASDTSGANGLTILNLADAA